MITIVWINFKHSFFCTFCLSSFHTFDLNWTISFHSYLYPWSWASFFLLLMLGLILSTVVFLKYINYMNCYLYDALNFTLQEIRWLHSQGAAGRLLIHPPLWPCSSASGWCISLGWLSTSLKALLPQFIVIPKSEMYQTYSLNLALLVWHYSMSHSELPEKAMASHSRTLAWKIPWKEEPGRLRSMGLLRVGHSWAISLSLFTFMHWRRKWQSTPEFLPGESQGWGSLVGFRLWVAQSRTRLKRLSSSSSSSSELHLYALEKLSVPPTNYRGTYHTSLLFFLPPSLIQISTMSWLFQKLFIEFSMCQIPYKAHTQVREFYMPLSS